MIKLMMGDCLERMKEIESGSVDLILTDPPFGTTAPLWDNVIKFELLWIELNRITKKDAVIAMTSAQPFTTELIKSNQKNFRYCWYWIKNQGTNFFHAKRMPIRKVEEICIFGIPRSLYNPQHTTGHTPTNSAKGCSNGNAYHGVNKRDYVGGETSRYPTNILEFNCVSNYERVHSSQKPVALMEYLIKTYSNDGETVLDFAIGSGTTMVACKNTGRRGIGIELDET
jgi:site-specific DNA-methyltransferase (adenine-specific)